jgi:hypothetical protein
VAEDNSTLPFATRLWFAWLCFFRVLFDGLFAARVWAAREAPALGPRAAGDGAKPLTGPSVPSSRSGEPARAEAQSGPNAVTALQLLSLFQREGRLVDFLQQDITSYPDAEVGAAARVVHDGCRKALRAHATIEPVFREDEGARVVLQGGFASDEVKLTGSVGGEPPYAGVLRHKGWRATRLDLPRVIGDHVARFLAPPLV